MESVAEDAQPGKVTSFPQSVQLKDDETVAFAYMVYKSRKHRDQVMEKVMKDPRMSKMMSRTDLPFDRNRMFFGGFKSLVASKAEST